MLASQRKQQILQILTEEKQVMSGELSQRFNVSEDSIRRDLRELAAEGIDPASDLRQLLVVGLPMDRVLEAVASGYADMVAWGKDFIANPDLVERLRRDAPLNPGRRELYYGGGAEGYTDYPRLAD